MPAFLLIPKRAAKQASLSPLAWMFIELLELYWIEDVKGVKSKLRDQKKKKKKKAVRPFNSSDRSTHSQPLSQTLKN